MVSSPSFDFPPASFSWKALPSPSVCEAPIPGEVASAAEDAGASFFCVRPSSRSFSKWVAVAYFSNPGAASELAKKLSELCGFPFCVVRSVDEWQLVSVPVSVAAFSYRVGSELPCLFSAF